MDDIYRNFYLYQLLQIERRENYNARRERTQIELVGVEATATTNNRFDIKTTIGTLVYIYSI
jgi:hypothetical protein